MHVDSAASQKTESCPVTYDLSETITEALRATEAKQEKQDECKIL